MSKKLKLIIQLIVLILLLLAVGLYFYFEKKPSLPEKEKEIIVPQVEFKVLKPGISDEVANIWARDFKQAKDAAGDNSENFNMSAWLAMGHILRQIGNYDDAIETYNYVSEMRPENSPSFYNLAVIYSSPEYQDFKKAEENFEIAISNQPNDLDYINALYELYRFRYLEKNDLADDILLAGLANNPNNERLTALLAEYYEAEGEIEKAREYYQKVLEINPKNEGAKRALDRLAK